LIERHLTFNVHPDRTPPSSSSSAASTGPPWRRAGLRAHCELLRESDSPTRYQLVFRFADAEKATAWRTSAIHQALQPA